ncbi:unnamed protein product, partial [Prorocentrum cordatum]
EMSSMLANMERRLGEQLQANTRNLSDIFQQSQLEFAQEMDDLRAEMAAVASTTPKGLPTTTGWSRTVDTTILAITARADVPKSAVADSLQQLLADADLATVQPDATRLEGEEIGRRFKLRCLGATGLAERRCGKLLELLRTGPSSWVHLNVGKDRNQSQISHEIQLKRLRTELREHIADRLFVGKDTIAVKWRQLVRLSIAAPGAKPQVSWNMAAVRSIGQAEQALQIVADRALAPEGESIHLGTWNCRALKQTGKQGIRKVKKKLKYLQNYWKGPVILGYKRRQRQWLDALRGATELMAGKPTHWNASTRTSTTIDRMFVGLPRWALCQGRQSCQLRGEARGLHIRGVSDHSLAVASLMRRPRPQRDPGVPAAIPRDIAMGPRFKEIAQGYLEAAPLQHLSPPDECKFYARFRRAAADDVQHELLVAEGWSRGSSAIIWRQLARACWRQNWRLAQLVVTQNARAQELARVDTEAKAAQIINYSEFQRRYNIAQRKEAASMRRRLEEDTMHETDENRKMQLSAQLRALRRRARLRAPISARRYLAVLEVDGAELKEPSDIRDALGRHWGKVLCPVEELQVSNGERTADWDERPAPRLADVRLALRRARPAAPGPDGLPAASWLALPSGPAVLHRALQWMLDGMSMRSDYNFAIGIFLPK